ncbi:hypothetical protein DPMN_111806 [Dreissena polymorpha]|uniref:Uncharacterized protein n=1 Tax=Dreissena polymorpha TaxID=45954 RepID=A0A9D4QQ41_DREPO|nr:hypothetical protein DPMN_111806 [Dreissena polymorpha]
MVCFSLRGLLGKGWCQSLHNLIVNRRERPHKVLKGSWIFVTMLDHTTFVKHQLWSHNLVTHQDIPPHPPPPPTSSSSLSKVMLGLYQLDLLVLEHKDENIMTIKVYVHPLTCREQNSKTISVLYAANQKGYMRN